MYTQAPGKGLLGSSPTRRRREIPDLWSAPVQGITISESSQLSFVSQLARSHPVSPLHSQIALANCARSISRLHKVIAQSQDWLRSLEIGTQFQNSENAQRNLEIAQIARLHGTYVLAYAFVRT